MHKMGIAWFIIMVIASSAFAQTIDDLNFYMSGGLSIPSGSHDNLFYQDANKDVGVGCGVSYRLTPEIYSVNGIEVSSFAWNSPGVTDERAFISTISSSIKYLLMQKNSGDKGTISPFLIGGIGISHVSVPDNTAYDNWFGNTSALYTSVGAGIEAPGGGLPGVFLEVRYAAGFYRHYISYIPIRFGFRGNI